LSKSTKSPLNVKTTITTDQILSSDAKEDDLFNFLSDIREYIEDEEKRKMAAAAKATASAPAATVKPGKTAENESTLTRVEPRPKAPRGEAPTLFLTPTDLALANNFEENRGKLYWPVEKGYITDHFGTHPHPLAPKVMIENA